MDFVSTLFVHGYEIPIRNCAGHIEFQELRTLLLGHFFAFLLRVYQLRNLIAFIQGLEFFHILCDQCFRADLCIFGYLKKQRLDFILVDGKRGAGVGTIFNLSRADPTAVFVAIFIRGFPAIICCAASGAVEFAGQQIRVVADSLP